MTKLEYVGDLKFSPAEPAPVTPTSSLDDWYVDAREQFALSRAVVPFLNGTDDDVERMVRDADDPEQKLDELVTLIERCQRWEGRYKAGTDVMRAVVCRLLVVCERCVGKEVMESSYGDYDA